jgi:hypothetical protein
MSNDLLGISESLTNNISSMQNILSNHEPSYASQFEHSTFDMENSPEASNDVYAKNHPQKSKRIEDELSYQGGWSRVDNGSMTYGLVPDDKLTHANMMPFFKEKYGYGSNDLRNHHAMNFKNELFTGGFKESTWKSKREVESFFQPAKNLTFTFGTPVLNDEHRDRFISGQFRQNEKPIEGMKVTPGLGLSHFEDGKPGMPYRILPKTVDELRAGKPKISHKGRIIESGLRGTKRPILAPFKTRRRPTYKVNKKEDVLPQTDIKKAPKVRANFMMKPTHKEEQLMEYTGSAFRDQGQNIPEDMKGKYKYPHRQNYTLPKPQNKFAKEKAIFNANIQSYDIPSTLREQTGENSYIPQPFDNHIYTNLMDVAKKTLKELNNEIPRQTFIHSNTMHGTVPPMDITQTTHRESILVPPHLITQQGSSSQKVYYSDAARTTIKESSLHEASPHNFHQDQQTYADPMDNPQPTIKETTLESFLNRPIFLPPQGATPYQDVAKVTTKETLPISQISLMQSSYDLPVVPLQDIAKPTTKESTISIPRPPIYQDNNHEGQVPLQDELKSTLKEINCQTTLPANYSPSILLPTVPYQDINRTTLKEKTLENPSHTFINSPQKNGKVGLQDILKTTLKEINEEKIYPHLSATNLFIASQQDIPACTLKEMTEQNSSYSFIKSNYNQGSSASFHRNPLDNTLKELSITDKDRTQIQLGKEGPQMSSDGIPLKTTHKETNNALQDPKPNQMIGLGYLAQEVNLLPTIKDTTLHQAYSAPIKGMSKPMIYDHVYHQEINDKKENMANYYRHFTHKGMDVGLGSEAYHIQVKKSSHKAREPMKGITCSSEDRPIPLSQLRKNDIVPHLPNTFLIDQLKTNPYHQKIA